MAIPKNSATLAVIIALLGSGCTQPDPNAAPSYTCTPSDGGTAAPCYKAEHDLQVKEDALYAEAEAVYRKYLTEDERIYRAGGVTDPTPAMMATLTGNGLSQAISTYRELATTAARAIGGEFKVGYLRRAPKAVKAGSVATWEACIDTRSVVFHDKNSDEHGSVGLERAYFSPTPDGLRISDFEHFEGEVTSCE